MIELNFSPYKTSKNYAINSVFVEENIFENKIEKHVKFSQNFDDGINFLHKKFEKTSNFIAENLEVEKRKNANHKQIFEIVKSIEKSYILDFDLTDVAFVGLNEIVVKENIDAKIIIKMHSNKKTYSNSTLKIVCEKNSRVDVCAVFDFDNETSNFVVFENIVENNAVLNFNVVDFGSRYSIQNFHSKIEGNNAVCNLNSIYLGDGEDLFDLLYLQDLVGKECVANIDVVGAIGGSAKKNFKGIINFEKGCAKSFGGENEFCLLLSKNAKSKALPMLMCGEEDVDGKHSTSVGRADPKQIFYLMSRGLDYGDALKLIVKAKLNNLIEKLFDEKLKEEINKRIDEKLNEK